MCIPGESNCVTDSDALLTLQTLHQINLLCVDSAMPHEQKVDSVAKPMCVSLSLASALYVSTDHSRSNAGVVVSVPASPAAPYEFPAVRQDTGSEGQ